MNTVDKLKAIMARCKCGVSLEVNDHRSIYQTAAEAVEELEAMHLLPDVPHDVVKKMIATESIITLHFYPETPVGFYRFMHYDLDAVLDQGLAALAAEGGK